MNFKLATLDLIAIANNRMTGDELRQQIILEQKAYFDSLPEEVKRLPSNRRRAYLKMMKKLSIEKDNLLAPKD